MNQEQQSFRILLRTLLARSNLTQAKLASEMGYGPGYLSKLINEQRPIQRVHVLDIIKVFVRYNTFVSQQEANQLLISFGMSELRQDIPEEAALLNALPSKVTDVPQPPSPRTVIALPAILITTIAVLGIVGILIMWIAPWAGVTSASHQCPTVSPNQPTTLREYRNVAQIYYDHDEFACVVIYLDVVIARHPNEWDYYRRGIAHYRLENRQLAIEDFTKTIDKMPDYAWAYLFRGLTYRELGQIDAARQDYEKVIALDMDEETRAIAEKRLAELLAQE